MRISINQACALTGKHRSTITRVTNEMQSVPGRKNALLYDSRELLQRLYVGADGAPTASEALRLLTIARTEQVKLQNDVIREKFYPRDQVHFLWKHAFTIVTATLKGNLNRLLTFETVNDIFAQIREAFAHMQEDGDRLEREFEQEKIAKAQAANGSGERQGGEGNNRRGNAEGVSAS